MSNSEIFLSVGEVCCRFALSLINLTPKAIDPSVYALMVILVSLFIWVQFLRGCWIIIKRLFGFGRR